MHIYIYTQLATVQTDNERKMQTNTCIHMHTTGYYSHRQPKKDANKHMYTYTHNWLLFRQTTKEGCKHTHAYIIVHTTGYYSDRCTRQIIIYFEIISTDPT